MIRKTIWEYYLLTLVLKFSTGIISATYVIYMQSKGLSLLEVNLSNFVFFFTLTVCEIPTGAFADVFGRKMSFVASCLIHAVAMIVFANSDSFFGFAIAEMMAAIGSTFMTGAFTAWFVDRLKHHGYDEALGNIFSKTEQIGQGAGIVAAIAGAYLASINNTLPWFLASVMFIICAALALTLKEEYFVQKKFSFKEGLAAMKQTAVDSFKYGLESANVRFILILFSVQVFAVQGLNMHWQPLFSQSIEEKSLGYIWGGISLSIMIGAWLAPKVLAKIKNERKVLIGCQIMIGVIIVIASMTNSLVTTLLMFFLHEMFRGAFKPLHSAYLHDNISPKHRATTESFGCMAYHFGGMLGLLFSGFIAQQFSITSGWMISGFILILSTLLIIKTGK